MRCFGFLCQLVPFLALAALYPAAALVRKYGWPRPAAVVAVVVSLAALGTSDLLVGGRAKRGETQPTTQWQRFVVECRLAGHWTTLGRWFGQHAQPDESLSTIAIGAIGYYSELRIVDPLGLVDPTIAHRKQRLGEGHTGHEKYDVQEVLAQRPGYILLVNLLTRAPVPLRRP